jgi:excisionase family DNA binding protein
MVSYDIYVLLNDIRTEQEKILDLLGKQFSGDSQPKVYDLVQIQEILHVSKRTIANWLQQGIMPHSRVGAKIWITETQLQEFLKQNDQETTKTRGLLKSERRGE